MKHTSTLLILLLLVFTSHAQNVGIGNTNPSFSLDVTGRMRIRQGATSAGIYFDGNLGPQRSFIGSYNNDYLGFWGTGSSWNMVMNVLNGNIGIGTIAPTSTLDIEGNLRLRIPGAKPGSTLTSTDISGNAVWAEPIAFRVEGSADGGNITMSDLVWTPINLSSQPVYNYGFSYLPNSGRFLAPYKGIYHFDIHLNWEGDGPVVAARIRRSRVGTVTTTLVETSNKWLDLTLESGRAYNGNNTIITCDLLLNKGDEIWLETYKQTGLNNGYPSIKGVPGLTWMDGRLATRLE